jgi:hypothetical protein
MPKTKETSAVEKEERGVRQVKDLKSRLGRIARDFSGQQGDVPERLCARVVVRWERAGMVPTTSRAGSTR